MSDLEYGSDLGGEGGYSEGGVTDAPGWVDPSRVPGTATTEPEAPEDDGSAEPAESTPQPTALDGLVSRVQGPQQASQDQQQAPQPVQHLQAQRQQLQNQFAVAAVQLQAQLPYMSEEQRAQVGAQWQYATAMAQAQMAQMDNQIQRAQLEVPARELAIERLVEEARKDNKSIKADEMRQFIGGFDDAKSVLIAAQRYAESARVRQVEVRKAKGTDKMGSGAASSTNSASPSDWRATIAEGLSELAKQGRNKR